MYEQLRRSIPYLAGNLLPGEDDKTKANAAGALSSLVLYSNKLCDEIISKGAMQVGRYVRLCMACMPILCPNVRETFQTFQNIKLDFWIPTNFSSVKKNRIFT